MPEGFGEYGEYGPRGGPTPPRAARRSARSDRNREQARETEDAAASAEPTEEAGFTLPGYIPLQTADDAMIRLLDAEDAALRDLAWQALPKFTIDDGSHRRHRFRGDEADQGPTRIQRVLQSAFRNSTGTPPSLPAFLDNLRDEDQATQAMAATVIYASPDVAADAAQRLYDSGDPVGEAVVEMTAEQRGIFASRVYEAIQDEVPEVAGVLRDPSRQSQVARWFGQQVATGTLPAPGAFAQQFSEDHLLDLAGSPDAELSRAAIAVLVNSVGGGKQDIDAVVNRFRQQGDQTVDALRDVWGPVKQDIYQRKLQSAAGPYRVRVEVSGERRQDRRRVRRDFGDPRGDPDFGPPRYEEPRNRGGGERGGGGILGLGGSDDEGGSSGAQVISLGIMKLVADGDGIRLANDAITLSVPQSHLAIRVDQPNQLKNFGKPELADLPLGESREPLDLFPQEGGAWSGEIVLDNGQTLAMTLEPAQSSDQSP
jgi:hypothetical protein